jgi:ATP-dependent DNA helicase RecG
MNSELQFLLSQDEGYNLEFKESVSSSLAKEICAFANANGGKIVVGVTNDKKIKGVSDVNTSKSKIQDYARNMDPSFSVTMKMLDDVLVVTVSEGKKKPYSANGKFYMRRGANSQQLKRDEIRVLFREEGFLQFDETPNKKFDFDNDFDTHKFKAFLDRAHISEVLDQKKILKNLMLIENGELKNAGVLLFCHRVTKFFFGATIKCVLFRGKNKYKILTMKEFDADLYSNYQNAITFLQSNLRTEYIIKAGPREEIFELPENALREAILNAIAHRDYYSTASIQVEIYEDRIEIVNPGGLIGNFTVKDLYSRSIPRNPLLFGLMQRMELVEKVGSGLLRINEAMEKYELPTPLIDADKYFFKITFIRPDLQKRTIEERIAKGEKTRGKTRGKTREKIILLIKEKPQITMKELAGEIGITEKGVEWQIKKLRDEKIIKRVGPAKGGYWEILQDG